MINIKNMSCPYCGGREIAETYMNGDAFVKGVKAWGIGQELYLSVCLNCGSVVWSYVKKPEKLIGRQEKAEPD